MVNRGVQQNQGYDSGAWVRGGRYASCDIYKNNLFVYSLSVLPFLTFFYIFQVYISSLCKSYDIVVNGYPASYIFLVCTKQMVIFIFLIDYLV